jgi:hypothetical protein
MSVLPALVLAATLSPSAQAAGLGPGIAVRQVVAPTQLVEGVPTLQVKAFTGPGGKGVAAEVIAGLEDGEREVGMGTAGDVASGVLKAGAQIGGQMIASKLGGGFGAKIAGGMVEGTANLAADKVAAEKVQLEDGLTTQPFQLVKSGATGVLTGKVTTQPKTENYTKEVPAKDKNGNTLKDSDGNTIMKKVSCTRRSVSASVAWAIASKGGEKASGVSERTSSDNHCAGDDGQLASVEALTQAATRGHGAAIVAEIAPAWKAFRIPLKRSPDARLPLMLIRKGEHEDALCVVHHMTGLDTTDPVAPLNEGALLEALGHYGEAATKYGEALSRKPGMKMAEKSLARTTARKAEVEGMVAAYGLDWKITPTDYAACPAMPDGRPAMAKKGKLELLDGPSGSALQTLDKGERVFVMATEGKMVKVQLMDGTEGYVSAKAIK